MQQRAADAAVEADDGQIAADAQVKLGRGAVDDDSDQVAAGQYRVGPGRGQERQDLGPRAGVAVILIEAR